MIHDSVTKQLSRRWLKRGNCIRHAYVVMELDVSEEQKKELFVVHGAVTMDDVPNVLHSWIQYRDYVFDLTRVYGKKVFPCHEYALNVSEQKVYPSIEMAHLMVARKEVAFWGFDDPKYISRRC